MIRVTYMSDAAYEGGAERYVEMLAAGLDRSRFRTAVIARDAPGLDAWCERIATKDVTVIRVPMNLPFRPLHAGPIARALASTAPQVTHVNSPGPYDGQMGLLAPIARLAGSRSVCVTEHLPMVERLWKRALVKRFAYRFVDRVFTVCEANTPFLAGRQRVPEHKQRVVYNGLPARFGEDAQGGRERFGIPEDAFALAFVGNLSRRKGVGVLLDAVGKLGQKICVVVAGDGEERKRLEGRAATMGSVVRFAGSLSTSGVATLLRAADALVVPSFMEGLPYVILEAMACSRPVIATDINGIPEAVENGRTGLLVPAGDADKLRQAIEHLIANHSECEQMGRRGRQRFEELFTLERHLDTMQQNYDDLAGVPS